MKKTIALVVLIVGGAACFASQAKRYFELGALPPSSGGLVFDRTLRLERLDIGGLYDDFRIVYRISPTEVNYYANNFWAEKTSTLLRNILLQRLAVPGLFRRLEAEIGKENPDWLMRVKVSRIEEVDEGERWSGRLAMAFEVVDFQTGARIAARAFDRTEPLGRKDVALLPAVISAILANEFELFLRELDLKSRDCPAP